MSVVKGLLLLFCISFISFAQAQDIHYTMFDMAPIRMNAAQTGFFEGTFRIGGIYRSQWQGMNPSGATTNKFGGYQTPHAYIDVPFGFRKKGSNGPMKNWAGVGVTFMSDQVAEYSTINATLALAYHLGFGQRGNTRLSFGVQGGIVQNQIDASGFLFEDGIRNGGSIDAYQTSTDNTLANSSASYADFSGGILFAHRASSRFNLEAGFALNHFTQPTYNFTNGTAGAIKLPMTMLGHVIVDVPLASRLLLRPMVFYQNNRNAQEVNAQALFGIHFNDMRDITLLLGGGYRVADAAFARIGLELKGLRFGFAYDINTRPALTPTGGSTNFSRPMGFEIGLSYIAKIYKNPVVKEILFCPRF